MSTSLSFATRSGVHSSVRMLTLIGSPASPGATSSGTARSFAISDTRSSRLFTRALTSTIASSATSTPTTW